MSDIADYETDFLLWSERQAELLRGLKGDARGLPNELDLENLAEEIETVGRSEFRAFESYLIQIFIHIIKCASNPDPDLQRGWQSEVFGFQLEAIDAMTPSMLRRADPDRMWQRAILKARTELGRYDEPLSGVPKSCPFALETFLVEQALDLEPMLEAMRERVECETSAG